MAVPCSPKWKVPILWSAVSLRLHRFGCLTVIRSLESPTISKSSQVLKMYLWQHSKLMVKKLGVFNSTPKYTTLRKAPNCWNISLPTSVDANRIGHRIRSSIRLLKSYRQNWVTTKWCSVSPVALTHRLLPCCCTRQSARTWPVFLSIWVCCAKTNSRMCFTPTRPWDSMWSECVLVTNSSLIWKEWQNQKRNARSLVVILSKYSMKRLRNWRMWNGWLRERFTLM